MRTSGYTTPASIPRARRWSKHLTVSPETLFRLFKYSVYSLLAVNVFLFGREEYLAALLQFPGGVTLNTMIEAYAATIDTAMWLVLLLMFELETYVLEDRHFTRPVTLALHSARALAYFFILYAFYGYVINVGFAYDVAPLADVSSLCSLAGSDWSYSVDLDEYVAITAENCVSLSNNSAFMQFGSLPAVVDLAGLVEIQRLAWVDAINAFAWILVVLVLEMDVRLIEANRFEGRIVRVSYVLKVALYATLFVAAVYWGFKGDFVDFWDAFLWLLAFFSIEMNVRKWQQEEDAAAASG